MSDMAEYVRLDGGEEEERQPAGETSTGDGGRMPRLASLDAFRGLSIFLMVLVDYAGSDFPSIGHSPWNGVHLADFVMPFFLFIAGVSIALAYKNVSSKITATSKSVLRAFELFLLGILLQGGYFHGAGSLTFGVDLERIRWLGILQRIAIGYIVAALCAIWLPFGTVWSERFILFKSNHFHWFIACSMCIIYMGLLYGLYVPDWQFKLPQSESSLLPSNGSYVILTVKCGVRGDLGPACNSAGMIDRLILGANHLYRKPVYRNLKECGELSPSWCHAPFEPEGILSSLTAAVACIIGLQFGHGLVKFEGHKDRVYDWLLHSALLLSLGLLLSIIGIPLNKSLYTTSYLLVTCAMAGFIFSALYILGDVCNLRQLTFILEWMGRHSLTIFVLIASNIGVIALQGFYFASPENNIIHWIIFHLTGR